MTPTSLDDKCYLIGTYTDDYGYDRENIKVNVNDPRRKIGKVEIVSTEDFSVIESMEYDSSEDCYRGTVPTGRIRMEIRAYIGTEGNYSNYFRKDVYQYRRNSSDRTINIKAEAQGMDIIGTVSVSPYYPVDAYGLWAGAGKDDGWEYGSGQELSEDGEASIRTTSEELKKGERYYYYAKLTDAEDTNRIIADDGLSQKKYFVAGENPSGTPTAGPVVSPTSAVTPTVTPTGGATPTGTVTPTEKPSITATPTQKASPTPTTKATPSPTTISIPTPIVPAEPPLVKRLMASEMGTPIASGALGANVTGSIYHVGDQYTLCIDGLGTNANQSIDEAEWAKDYIDLITDAEVRGNIAYSNCALFSLKNLEYITYSANVVQPDIMRWDKEVKQIVFEPGSLCKKIGQHGVKAMYNGDNYDAYTGCTALQYIVLPDSLEVIDSYMFRNSGIKYIRIPASVTQIGYEAFQGCSELETVVFEKSKEKTLDLYPYVFEDCVKLNNVVIPERWNVRGGNPFYNCSSLTTAAMEEGAEKVPNELFKNRDSLKYFTFPASIKEIGNSAFYKTSLVVVNLPNNLETIESSAFEYNDTIQSISIPASVKSIGSFAFANWSKLSNVTLEKGALENDLYIGGGCFSNDYMITSFYVSSRIDSTGGRVFSGCSSLSSISFEDGISKIPDGIFSSTTLREIRIPDTVKTIGAQAFSECTLITQFDLPRGITVIGKNAFSKTSIKEIIIPDKVEVLNGFKDCTSLTTITLPYCLSTVEEGAFEGCKKLETVYYSGKDKSQIVNKGGNYSSGNNAELFKLEWIKVAPQPTPTSVPTPTPTPKPGEKSGEITINGESVVSLSAAFKKMKDKNTDYVLSLGSDLKGEKNISIPKTAKSLTIEGNGYTIYMTGTKITANTSLILKDVEFLSQNNKGKSTKIQLTAKKGLQVDDGVNFTADDVTVKTKWELVINGSFRANKATCQWVSIEEGGSWDIPSGAKISISKDLKGEGGEIVLESGFNRPISISGTASGDIHCTGEKQADGTQIMKAKAKALSDKQLREVFDVSDITENKAETHLYYLNKTAVGIFGEAIEYNGNNYALWKDVIAQMDKDKKSGVREFEVSFSEDVNLGGKFKMPSKGYDQLIIEGNGNTVTFTGDIKLTGNTEISEDTVLRKVNAKGYQVHGKVIRGKYLYSGPMTF